LQSLLAIPSLTIFSNSNKFWDCLFISVHHDWFRVSWLSDHVCMFKYGITALSIFLWPYQVRPCLRGARDVSTSICRNPMGFTMSGHYCASLPINL
jgi:hypothetical protein